MARSYHETHRPKFPCCAAAAPAEACAEAMHQHLAGRLEGAERSYRSLLRIAPGHAGANYGLGMLQVQLLRPADGMPYLLTALHAQPEVPDHWLGTLEALLLLGELDEAERTLALARRHGLAGPATEELAARLAAALLAVAEAIRPVESALLSVVRAGRFREALPLARGMTERFPTYGVGWKILGAMLWAAGEEPSALEAMQRSVRLLPEDAEALCNLGTALAKIPRVDEAERWLLRALKIDPVFAAAHVKLGTVYQLQGRYGEAEISLRRAMALYPDEYVAANDTPHSSLLFMLNHDPGVQADALFAEHCRVGAYLEGGLRHSQPQRRPRAEAARCLQVGFVSADFRYHSVASFIEPILRCWRRSERLRITLYHNNPIEDEVSRRLRGYVSRWHTVFDLSNAELVARIREDRIDILIDLAGHTAMHRLRVFAHKPAPVQVSWLGYPATTGLQAMDYYLTDRHFFPKGEFDRYFTEKLVYVPAVWTFDPSALAPPVNRLPALTLGYLTFGSFNRLGKINETTIQLWARLLRALPTARMLIVGIPLEQKHRVLIDWFAAAGITRERLGFHPWTDTETHLKFHNQVDIALESTPYTGCTTSNHALWMGVPSLTLAGSTPASRLCAANLGHLGLDEFIAASPDEFVAKGLYWAGRLDALADLRAGLRSRWQRSPARDSAFVAAGIEVALRRMWQRWCSGSPPQSFEVTAAEALASIPRTSGTLV